LILTFFRPHLLAYLSTSYTIGPLCFQAGGHRRQPNPASVDEVMIGWWVVSSVLCAV